METRSAKRKRLTVARDNVRYTGEDRISELPDDVLHHILSLLPTKTIVLMSILSSRWRLIWSSFTDLDFSSIPYKITNKKKRKKMDNCEVNFLDFISRVLALHNKKSSDIRALRFSAEISFSRLNLLIKQAVSRNVQELDLEIKTKDCFNLTRSVVTCKSLEVLKLKSNKGFRLPPSRTMNDGFQALHTLSFSRVVFDGQPSLLDLFSENSFPLLKKLDLVNCLGLKYLRIACRAIIDIALDRCVHLIDLSICCSKLERLKVTNCFSGYGGHAKIDAPLIKTFVWKSNGFVDSSYVENLTCLEDASISLLDSNNISAPDVSTLTNLLCGISFSRRIKLNDQCFKILTTEDDTTSILPHSFDNLKILELNIGSATRQISTLASLLKISPSLRTLIINIDCHPKIEMKEWDKERCDRFITEEELYWEWKIHRFNTFKHNLKVVKINGFNEYMFVFCLTKFLNKYGICLQEMKLSLRNLKAREKLKSQFNGFPWASSISEIDFGNNPVLNSP